MPPSLKLTSKVSMGVRNLQIVHTPRLLDKTCGHGERLLNVAARVSPSILHGVHYKSLVRSVDRDGLDLFKRNRVIPSPDVTVR